MASRLSLGAGINGRVALVAARKTQNAFELPKTPWKAAAKHCMDHQRVLYPQSQILLVAADNLLECTKLLSVLILEGRASCCQLFIFPWALWH